jgi:hypothetical protein
MPAPQASMMQQLARAKFMSFALKVPTNWQDPSGDPAATHYGKAFKDTEKTSVPGAPPLVQAASMNKYHTDTQKMHIDKIGSFIDKTCSAICSAWSQWQSLATMTGLIIMGPLVSVGVLVGPPLAPLIMASGEMSTPNYIKYTTAIANAIGMAWLTFTGTVKILPPFAGFPAYSAPLITPVAPPTPNIPIPWSSLLSIPVSISADILKAQMIANLGDPQAPFNKELFESIATAFNQCYQAWALQTMLNNMVPIATGGTPVSPLPAVGTAIMPPGGIT